MLPVAPTVAQYASRPSAGAREGGRRPAPRGEPVVSVVTVVYQGARTIQQTIDSVRTQERDDVEYIVIDGGSTDGTLDILARNDEHITCWRSEPDAGIFDAMNKGVALARGPLVKLLNADDLLCPDSIRHAVAAFAGGARGGVIMSDLELIDEHGVYIKTMDATRGSNPFGGVVHPSWYVDREVYQRHGLYLPALRICADYEMFVRLRTRGVPFFQVATPLVRFRTGGASSSTLVGLRERYRTNVEYLGVPSALWQMAVHGSVKTRARLLRTVFDEHTVATLQRRVRSAMGRRR